MGSGQSTFSSTPLGCMLDNWKVFRRQADYGTVLCKDNLVRFYNLVRFCTLEWTTFGVEWPEGGTLKPEIVQAVHSVVTRDGHWDQYPYIDIWQGLVANPPPWLRKCKVQTIKTLMARARIRKPCPPVKKSCPPTVIPSAPDPMPPPPLYPGLPVLGGPVLQGPLQRNYLCPLRETIAPEGNLTMVYVPFTTSDLYNWKQQNPPFSEDPTPLTAVFETLITAHNPTWGDMRVALNTLLTAEERRLVLSRAREWVAETEGDSAAVAARLPESPPNWSHVAAGRAHHSQYATAIVQGMKRCIRKTPNWAKLYNIRQERNENPAAFYERLCNICKRYTDLDPEDINGKRVLIPLFIGQSYEDIRKKLQKLEGVCTTGRNNSEFLQS
uniref:Core shell protein Gag P30 domain-containing protein n=1 Tax=Chrysemys picta bellii TaxID=8478 RepID=A0A8C3HU22_CHRPI